MDDARLMALLRGGRAGDASPPPGGVPLRMTDLVARIVETLERERWFPRVWAPAEPGHLVHEGGTIERMGPLLYVYRVQRHHPLDPTKVVDTSTRLFLSGSSAARHYLRWDLNLPGRLGGHPVVDYGWRRWAPWARKRP